MIVGVSSPGMVLVLARPGSSRPGSSHPGSSWSRSPRSSYKWLGTVLCSLWLRALTDSENGAFGL